VSARFGRSVRTELGTNWRYVSRDTNLLSGVILSATGSHADLFAMGIGSQYIAVVPAFRLVVVATGGNDYNDQQPDILEVAKRHLMPGLR
jgi:hypothetical protein